MAKDCCSTGNNIMILTCSGGSNVGQLSNRAAVELTSEGVGKMFCLAGIGGHLSGFVQSAKDVEEMVVIDGCQIGCAKATLEHAEIPVKNHILVTELGIEKNKDFNLKDEDLLKVKEAVKAFCKESAAGNCSCKTASGACCG